MSATSTTGYSGAAPEGRYIAPANGPDCIETGMIPGSDANVGFGECGLTSVVVTGPKLVRFDLSAVKRIPVKGRVSFEFRAEFLKTFNTPWFTPVTGADDDGLFNDPDEFEVSQGNTGRTVQLVWRINW